MGDDVAVVSVMWANNEIGTVSDITGAGRPSPARWGSRCTPRPSRPSGRFRSDFAASGVGRPDPDRAQVGGLMGAGALLLRRDAECTPLLHGGGQERDVRSGKLDVAGDRRAGRGDGGRRRPREARAAGVASWRRLLPGSASRRPTPS